MDRESQHAFPDCCNVICQNELESKIRRRDGTDETTLDDPVRLGHSGIKYNYYR